MMDTEDLDWEQVDWFAGAIAASDELALPESAHESPSALAYPAPKPLPQPVPKPLPVPARRISHVHGPRVSAPLQVQSSSSHRPHKGQHSMRGLDVIILAPLYRVQIA